MNVRTLTGLALVALAVAGSVDAFSAVMNQ